VTVGTQFGMVVGFVKSLPGKIASVGRSMWNGLKSGLSAVISRIVARLPDLLSVYNDTAGQILGTINVNDPTAGKGLGLGADSGVLRGPGGAGGDGFGGRKAPPWFAAGGVASGWGRFRVGERGPEMATIMGSRLRIGPLSQAGGLPALSGGGIEVHPHGIYLDGERLPG
jgi:hypothetical protein